MVGRVEGEILNTVEHKLAVDAILYSAGAFGAIVAGLEFLGPHIAKLFGVQKHAKLLKADNNLAPIKPWWTPAQQLAWNNSPANKALKARGLVVDRVNDAFRRWLKTKSPTDANIMAQGIVEFVSMGGVLPSALRDAIEKAASKSKAPLPAPELAIEPESGFAEPFLGSAPGFGVPASVDNPFLSTFDPPQFGAEQLQEPLNALASLGLVESPARESSGSVALAGASSDPSAPAARTTGSGALLLLSPLLLLLL